MGSWKKSPFLLPTLLSFHWPSPDRGVRMNVSSTLKSELFLNLSPEFNLSAKVCMYERIRWLPFRSSSTVKLIDWKACVYPSACILKRRVWCGTKSFYFFISLSIEHSNAKVSSSPTSSPEDGSRNCCRRAVNHCFSAIFFFHPLRDPFGLKDNSNNSNSCTEFNNSWSDISSLSSSRSFLLDVLNMMKIKPEWNKQFQ